MPFKLRLVKGTPRAILTLSPIHRRLNPHHNHTRTSLSSSWDDSVRRLRLLHVIEKNPCIKGLTRISNERRTHRRHAVIQDVTPPIRLRVGASPTEVVASTMGQPLFWPRASRISRGVQVTSHQCDRPGAPSEWRLATSSMNLHQKDHHGKADFNTVRRALLGSFSFSTKQNKLFISRSAECRLTLFEKTITRYSTHSRVFANIARWNFPNNADVCGSPGGTR